VVAPDLRGYHLSDRPQGVEPYRIQVLLDDLLGLLDALGERDGLVVGHDWGGVLAWFLAMLHPQRVRRLVILNAPHPALFARELRRPRQLWRSWYIFFFQLPLLPEWLLRLGNFALLERTWRRDSVTSSAFSATDLQAYRAALASPGALTAMLNYYRAAFRHGGQLETRLQLITTPTLVLWGERDRYLNPHLLDGLEEWVRELRVERLPEASHWLACEFPEQVNGRLVAFLEAGQQ
jgi:pimeloyl-ACP methyl ester carboxylesterase